MKNTNQELIRRVLSSVLSRIGDNETTPTKLIAEAASDASPVVFIILNDSQSREENDERHLRAADSAASKKNDAGSLENNSKGLKHPEFERFSSVEAKSDGLAPKTCFMEPGRACVNSGACEMRGF